ncbi:hypothetical protein JXJ21_06730 [candidate division KSB1 bacterium]|nr:hypothetical protein [candidate division KSB1 bacterium]
MKSSVSGILICIFLMTSMLCAETTITIGSRKIPGKSHFSFFVSGASTSPRHYFSENYDPANGISLGIGFAVTPLQNNSIHVGTFFLRYHKDKFDMKGVTGILNKNNKSSISSIFIGGDVGFPIILTKKNDFTIAPSLGRGFGLSWFSIDESLYNKLGKSTLTELKHEKDKLQISSMFQIGLLVTGLNHVSIKYSYDFMNIERAFMTGHWIISAGIQGLLTEGIPEIIEIFLPKEKTEKTTYAVVKLVYATAASIFWYDFTYENHNWPFDDDPPLRFNRHLLTLNYYF